MRVIAAAFVLLMGIAGCARGGAGSESGNLEAFCQAADDFDNAQGKGDTLDAARRMAENAADEVRDLAERFLEGLERAARGEVGEDSENSEFAEAADELQEFAEDVC